MKFIGRFIGGKDGLFVGASRLREPTNQEGEISAKKVANVHIAASPDYLVVYT
jgi:hypothetical protein